MENNESYIDIPNMNPGFGNNFSAKWPMGTDCQCDSNVIVMDAKEFNLELRKWLLRLFINCGSRSILAYQSEGQSTKHC